MNQQGLYSQKYWFFQELVTNHGINNWYNSRYGVAVEKLLQEADRNGDRVMDMSEYIR